MVKIPKGEEWQFLGKRNSLILPQFHLSYLEWMPNGSPILLLHGFGGSALAWVNLAQSLEDKYYCVAPDLRDHGETGKPHGLYGYLDIIADLEELFKHLQWSNAHIVGHSWGAKLAALWAGHIPQSFRSLILVDPPEPLDELIEIEVPCLFLQPTKGLNHTQEQMNSYKRYIPNLTLKNIPGNHWPFFSNPVEFHMAIRDFLSSLEVG